MPRVELTGRDGITITAHRADPVGIPSGGVVVLQEVFGVNDHIRDVADRFAADGFVALAPALFDRLAPGCEFDYDRDGMAQGQSLAWQRLPITDALADATTALDTLASELGAAASVGAVGFCYGGMLASALASREGGHLGAAVAYYPSRAARLLVEDRPAVPLMVHLGQRDQGISAEDGRALGRRWPTATFHRYPTAGHGFNCDRRDSYDAEAAPLAWSRTVTFLRTNLSPPAP